MNKAIKAAIDVLRQEGVRIPRGFTKRLKVKGYLPKRRDIALIKKRITGMSRGDKFVVGMSQRGSIVVHHLAAYNKLLGVAAHARDGKKAR